MYRRRARWQIDPYRLSIPSGEHESEIGRRAALIVAPSQDAKNLARGTHDSEASAIGRKQNPKRTRSGLGREQASDARWGTGGKIAEEAYNQWKANKAFSASMEALVKAAKSGSVPAAKDAWNHSITYRKTSLGITVPSPGPNGKDEDDDDIQVSIGNDGKPSLD